MKTIIADICVAAAAVSLIIWGVMVIRHATGKKRDKKYKE